MRQTFDATKPGGYAEFQDFDVTYYSEDGSLKPEHEMQKWISTLLNASRDFNRDPCPGSKLECWMKDAGFEDVRHERYRLPIGPWPKDKHLVSPHCFTSLICQTSEIPLRLTRLTENHWRLEPSAD